MGSKSDSKGFITRRCESRGQTTLDFAIGMSIFLAVVVFIFLFIPGILSPFSQGGQADTASSNRVADQLAQGALGSPSEPFVLDRYCTVEFFANGSQDQCQYDDEPPERQLGLDRFQSVNITIKADLDTPADGAEILCWDNGDGLIEQSDPGGACDVQLARGDPLSASTDDSVTSQRLVSLNRDDVTLYVRMW